MSMTDPISNFLTCLRNAQAAAHPATECPSSKVIVALAKVLKDEGFIQDYMVLDDRKQGIIRVDLKYVDRKPAIRKIDRVSRPGRRVYCPAKEVPWVLRGLGVALISTPKGILTDKQARQQNMGGEILCTVY